MKSFRKLLLNFWKKLGPGLITGASDDDPSGIATYSQAGAGFGLSTLWTAVITFPMMASIQEMCARIGMVTSKGLTGNLKTHYPKSVLYLMILLSFPAITLNIGADIAGMGAVGHMLLPPIPEFVFSILFTAILLFSIILFPYKKIAAILKYLCLTLLVYFIVPFLCQQDFTAIITSTFKPTLSFDKTFLSVLVGILGTTISPYLFFWQANMEVEELKLIGQNEVTADQLKAMRKDINFGMFFSNLVMFFIILTTGTVLFNNGVHTINTVEDAAIALEPLAGKLTYLLFALGILGTGFLAIPVLSGSLSYIICETFDWNEGLNNKFYEAKAFYVVISISMIFGLIINLLGISPVKALLFAAVLYGLTAPILLLLILLICNNKKIMGSHTNKKYANVMGLVTFFVMLLAGIFYLLA